MFDFKRTLYQAKRREFCYAGDWTAYINIGTGRITKCYCPVEIANVFDMSKPIKFEAIGKCPLAYCYNGHAHLALGVVPFLATPTYADIRNRKCIDGTEWLNPKMKQFMTGKLKESNRGYSCAKRLWIRAKAGIQSASCVASNVTRRIVAAKKS
jgi:hypothetical protein